MRDIRTRPHWLDDYQWFVVETSEGWYWHLYWKDERINGGITDYEYDSGKEAEYVAYKHHSDEHMAAQSALQYSRRRATWRGELHDGQVDGQAEVWA